MTFVPRYTASRLSSIPLEIWNEHIFSRLSFKELKNVSLSSQEFYALASSSRIQRIKKRYKKMQRTLVIFQDLIPLQSQPFQSNENQNKIIRLNMQNLRKQLNSEISFRIILKNTHKNLKKTAQGIRDQDLVTVFKRILPDQMKNQIKDLSNFQAASSIRDWLKNLDTQDAFFQQDTFYLGSQDISSFPPELCTYFPHARRFSLFCNIIRTLPSEIKNLTKLETLFLSFNKIIYIPPEISYLTNLTSLDLSHNTKLGAIPSEIFHLVSLTELEIASTKSISTIPHEIGLLSSLRKLNLNDNKIQSVPPEIGRLLKLQTLDLRWNEIRSIPREIGLLSSLCNLNLNENQIQSVPPEIGQLQELQILGLGGNRLRSVSREISLLTKLKTLTLEQNEKISSLSQAISQLRDLEALYLDGTDVYDLPYGVQQLSHLHDVDAQVQSIIASNSWRLPFPYQQIKTCSKICCYVISLISAGTAFYGFCYLADKCN